MKSFLACILVLVLTFGFGGCGEKEPVLEPLSSEEMAKYNVVESFYTGGGCPNCSVMAQAVSDDGAYGLLGAVQYTDGDGNPSCIGFVFNDRVVSETISKANAFDVIPNSSFNYLGNGSVSVELKNRETEEIYTYKVTYSADENGKKEKISVEKIN